MPCCLPSLADCYLTLCINRYQVTGIHCFIFQQFTLLQFQHLFIKMVSSFPKLNCIFDWIWSRVFILSRHLLWKYHLSLSVSEIQLIHERRWQCKGFQMLTTMFQMFIYQTVDQTFYSNLNFKMDLPKSKLCFYF